MVTPSDALVIITSEYQRVLSKALSYTSDNNTIVTIGIKPSHPETGNGYIVVEKNGKLLVCSLKEEQRIKEFENNICQIKHQIIISE